MLPGSQTPRQNHLLASLPPADYARLLPALELLPMPLGLGVYDGDMQSGVYFPTDSIVSLVHGMANGGGTEVAATGNDGLVGMHLLMGGETWPGRAVVRSAGLAYRLGTAILRQEMANGGPFPNLMLRYVQSLMTQIAQNAACARRHTVEQRLCRWLLMSFDLMPADQLTTTQAQIASMLGVRREVVTKAAGNLQADGLIRYSRGHITALDRPKLEQRVCECYAALVHETNRLIREKSQTSTLARRSLPPSLKPADRMHPNARSSLWQGGAVYGKK